MSKEPDAAVAQVFFALGDETRLAVLARIGAGARSATALCNGSRVTRQAIVKHLQVLQSAGLVSRKKQGREVLYALDAHRLDEARAFLGMISARWDRAIDRLSEMVEEQPSRLPKKDVRR